MGFSGSDSLLHALLEISHAVDHDLTRDLFCIRFVPLTDDTTYPLVRAFRSCVGTAKVNAISLEGWLNAVVLVEALRRAGPNASRQGFVHALESLKGWDPGLGVKLGFSHTCHEGMHRVWLTRVVHGRWMSVIVRGNR
jgi:hypothetical protein